MRRVKRTACNTAFVVMGTILFGLIVMTFVTAGPAYADNWADLSGAETLRKFVAGASGAETLRKFVAGASAEIELRQGVVAIGEYYEDGTAKIEAWGETFPRTWEVRGDDQVCYSSATETNCYTFEQNLDVPGEYRVRHVETGELISFSVGRIGES